MMITNTSINKIFLLVNFNVSALVSHETMMMQEISKSESKLYFIISFSNVEQENKSMFRLASRLPPALTGYDEKVHNKEKHLLMGLDLF